MPTYEYECKTCSHRFEIFQNMSDAPVKVCPECGKAVRRLIGGGAGIIFKGSGFYVTDNKAGSAGGKKAKNPETKTAEGSSASASAEKTEKSPAKEKKETKEKAPA
jgi:putative FmdB family regulatory protein